MHVAIQKILLVYVLAKTPLEVSYDVYVHKEPPSLDCDNVLPNPLDHSHVFSLCSPTFPSLEYYFDAPIYNPMICDAIMNLGSEDNMFNALGGNVINFLSLGYFSGYDASLNPYCIYLVDEPRKIMWTNFFDFSFDFSMNFALLKRSIIFFIVTIIMLSYYHACETKSVEFGKPLQALTAYDLTGRVLKL